MNAQWVVNVLFLVAALDIIIPVFSNQCPQLTLKNGRTRLRGKKRMMNFRCLRGFTRVGPRFAMCLKTNQWSQKPPICVTGRGCPKLQLSKSLKIDRLYRGGVRRFTCAPGLIRSGPEEIHCDGSQWSAPPPKCLEGMSMGCDFEEDGNCGWNHDSDGHFEWTRNSGGTPTANTGPQVDHTTNSSSGFYLFMESSAPQDAGHKARLISPPYTPDKVEGLCLEFYYHMFGPDERGAVGELDVYVKPQTTPTLALSPAHNIFSLEGNHGDVWHRADVDIPEQTESFEIVFQGTRLSGWVSDIAIDDIRLFNCSERPETTTMDLITATLYDSTTDPVTTTTRSTRPSTWPTTPTTEPTTTTTATSTTSTSTTTASTTEIPTTTVTTSTTPPTTTTTPTTTSTTDPTTTTVPTTTTSPTVPSTTTTPTVPTTTTTQTVPTTTTTPTLPTTTTTSTLPTTTTTPTVPTTTTTPTTTTSCNSSPSTTTPTTTDTTTIPSSTSTPPPPQPTSTWSTSLPQDESTDSTTIATKPTPDDPVSTPDFMDVEDSTPEDIDTPVYDNDDDVTKSSPTTNATPENPIIGNSRGATQDGSDSDGIGGLLPLIAGVIAAVLVASVVIALLSWTWAKNQKRKQDKDNDDQMNIISDYVETNLSI